MCHLSEQARQEVCIGNVAHSDVTSRMTLSTSSPASPTMSRRTKSMRLNRNVGLKRGNLAPTAVGAKFFSFNSTFVLSS
jgi:hypothetical protein